MSTRSVFRKINPISDIVIDGTCTLGCDDTLSLSYEFLVYYSTNSTYINWQRLDNRKSEFILGKRDENNSQLQ